jgi:K+-transporting ATPase ATPase C chain
MIRLLVRPALVLLLIMTLLTGVGYPLLVTVLAQAAFPIEANGSLITVDGQPVGSALIGQNFSAPQYFWGRLSATGPLPYNASASSGSNLGPLNPTLLDVAQARIAALKAADPENSTAIPVDLVTASASGLDPQISPAAAAYQVERVARLRHLDVAKVQELVATYTEARQWGVLGEPRVNVLQLNLALDRLSTP